MKRRSTYDHLKCLLGAHDWNGCKCYKCGRTHNKGHNWNGCKCYKCGRTRDDEHAWRADCEKCSVCGKTRDGRHDWREDCQKCSICGKTSREQHKWRSGKCDSCQQVLYSGPTFKMLLISVSRSDALLPFIRMAASQTGIVPKDIPQHKHWIEENLLWYERNPWYPPSAEEMLGMAQKAWGDTVLDRSRNEILIKPWQLNALGSGGVMCVIRDKSLSKPRQLLHNVGLSPPHFTYLWHRAPEHLENQMIELIRPMSSEYPHISFKDGTMEIVLSSWCLDEEDVVTIHSTIKTLVDANGGELSRIVPDSCQHCSRTIPEISLLKCPYCGQTKR